MYENTKYSSAISIGFFGEPFYTLGLKNYYNDCQIKKAGDSEWI